jgi:hypothetical protein
MIKKIISILKQIFSITVKITIINNSIDSTQIDSFSIVLFNFKVWASFLQASRQLLTPSAGNKYISHFGNYYLCNIFMLHTDFIITQNI